LITPSRRRARRGLSLTEVLVAMAIIGVLAGLLIPAVQAVREAANRATCANNIKQLVLANVNFNLTYGRLPPGIGPFPRIGNNWLGPGQPVPQAFAGGAFYLLPFLGEENLYASAAGKVGTAPGCANATYAGMLCAEFNGVFSTPLKVFQCPSDPSQPTGGVVQDTVLAALAGSTSLDTPGGTGYFTTWGTSSYAGNLQIYGLVDRNPPDGGPGGYPPTAASAATGPPTSFSHTPPFINMGFGYYAWVPDGASRIPDSFPDGLSTTILVAEKYAQCTNAIFGPPNYSGGNYWAYGVDNWAAGATVSGESQLIGLSAGTNTAFLPRIMPLYPAFADAAYDEPPSPLSSNMISIGPASKPLFRPQPFTGPGSQCDPRLASTAHAAMQVGMADASVHSVSSGISGATWWAAVTPCGHDPIGSDW
jgi:prepilin-type N-terminal cleavage/methylation domain-containing protein